MEADPNLTPPGKTPAQLLGQRIGMALCALIGLAVAFGPGVQKNQRILGAIFFLACGLLLAWKMWRKR